MKPNGFIKGIALGTGIIIGLIAFLIAAIFLFFVGRAIFNSSQLKSSSPLTHYIVSLEAEESTDVSLYFENPATKAEVFEFLSGQGYHWKSYALESPDLDPKFDEYAFGRSLPGCGYVHVNAALTVRFDKSDNFVSAKGYRSKCYQ